MLPLSVHIVDIVGVCTTHKVITLAEGAHRSGPGEEKLRFNGRHTRDLQSALRCHHGTHLLDIFSNKHLVSIFSTFLDIILFH